jgi:hypothetical protein
MRIKSAPWRQRRVQTAAVAGLAAAMVAAVLIVGLGLNDSPGSDPAADRAARLLTASPSAAPSAVGSAVAPSAAAPKAAPSPTPGAAKKVARPPAAAAVMATASGDVQKDHKTIKVVTSHSDLTGQGELAWAADAGHAVDGAKCTQNFRFNPGSKVGERPTMLLCWRTSATKSVYTLAVDVDRRPSEKDSVAALDKAWQKLG